MTVSRFVTLLTPVFAALAGWLCDVAAQYLPGHPSLDRGELTALFIVGATAATTAAVKWLHGRSAFERQRAALAVRALERERALAVAQQAPVVPDPPKPKSKPRTRRKASPKRAAPAPEPPAST